jgi:hypothetical protein
MWKPTVFPNGIIAGGVSVGDLNGTGAPVISGATASGPVASDSLQVGTTNGTPLTQVRVYSQALTPVAVALSTTAEQTFTVTGLTTADKVFVNWAANTAGIGIVGMRVSAANTLAITYVNATVGALTPAAGTYQIVAFRS